jgi:hypothetical protein
MDWTCSSSPSTRALPVTATTRSRCVDMSSYCGSRAVRADRVFRRLLSRTKWSMGFRSRSFPTRTCMAGRWTGSWRRSANATTVSRDHPLDMQPGLSLNCRHSRRADFVIGTFCGVFRRQALDRGAAQLSVDHIVTGHNADDIAETVLMNSTLCFPTLTVINGDCISIVPPAKVLS